MVGEGLPEEVQGNLAINSRRYASRLCAILSTEQARKRLAEIVKAKRMQDDPNRLIRELLNEKRIPTKREINTILGHVAKATFSTRPVSVEKDLRGQVFQGHKLENKEPSIIAHLAKRILEDQDWANDVTPEEYLSHLQSVANAPELRICVYIRQDGRLFLGLFAQNKIPAARLGKNSSDFLWVVYSVDYGTITTGYQVKGIEEIAFPKEVRWL